MFRTLLKTLGFLAILFGTFITVLTGGWLAIPGLFFIVSGLLFYLFDCLITRYIKKRSSWIVAQILVALLYFSLILWMCYDIGILGKEPVGDALLGDPVV